MNSLSIVYLPPRENVPAQRTRRTNAFTAACDKKAMRPLAELLWTLVLLHRHGTSTVTSVVSL